MPSASSLPFSIVCELIEDQLRAVRARRKEFKERGGTPRTLHDFRSAVRRLEGVVGLSQWAVRPTAYSRAVGYIVPAARGLGRYRDLDILQGRLQDLFAKAESRQRPGLEHLLQEVKRRRRKGRAGAVRRAVEASSRPNLDRPLRKLFKDVDPDRPGDPLAFPASRVALRAARIAEERPKDDEFHAFRLEMKCLRYGLEALASHETAEESFPLKTEATQAAEVTQLLGRLRDTAALLALADAWRETTMGSLDRLRPFIAGVLLVREEAAHALETLRTEFFDGWSGNRWALLQRSIREHAVPSSAATIATTVAGPGRPASIPAARPRP